jgi:hypothetical protein
MFNQKDDILCTQKYLLSGKTCDDLSNEFCIKTNFHPDLPLVILNYDQINSPKKHPVVRECRGLVLNSSDWSLVARSFPRFFNWGEVPEEMDFFDFDDFVVQSKEDGSLVIIYFFNNEWHINTKGSFATDLMQNQSFTWRQAVCKGLGINDLKDLNSILDPKLTYICEFVSPWNKVVRYYKKPQVYLLTAFEEHKEISLENIDVSRISIFQNLDIFQFRSIQQIQKFLEEKSVEDKTFEGFVICDKNKNRWKIKNPSYLSLHKIKGEGDNLFHPKYLLPFVLKNEADELFTYFEEVKDQYFSIKNQVDNFYEQALKIWQENKNIESQKEFALSIQQEDFKSVLFDVRKKYGQNQTEKNLREEFLAHPDLILKKLKSKQSVFQDS